MMHIESLVGFVTENVVPLVDAFRRLQTTDGSVPHLHAEAKDILTQLCPVVRQAYALVNAPDACADAFRTDVEQWIARGLDTAPTFDTSVAAYSAPALSSLSFFIAPAVLTNGPVPCGAYLECFLAYREEPEDLVKMIPQIADYHIPFSTCRLFAASAGLCVSNCLVFFPEHVTTAEKFSSQSFALAFSNKFQHIFSTQTLPRAHQLFKKQHWDAEKLSPADSYNAHCVRCFLHEYFHLLGPRPLNTNLRVKMNFFAGLLEETKVDCQSVELAYQKNFAFKQEVMEFILLERLLRYPNQEDATKNFDAASGFLLFEWLRRNADCFDQADDGWTIDIERCVTGIGKLAKEIEALETVEDDAAYRQATKAFVRTLLPEGKKGERFSIPASYPLHITGIELPVLPLDFAHLY